MLEDIFFKELEDETQSKVIEKMNIEFDKYNKINNELLRFQKKSNINHDQIPELLRRMCKLFYDHEDKKLHFTERQLKSTHCIGYNSREYDYSFSTYGNSNDYTLTFYNKEEMNALDIKNTLEKMRKVEEKYTGTIEEFDYIFSLFC